jgi:hypothetical protein
MKIFTAMGTSHVTQENRFIKLTFATIGGHRDAFIMVEGILQQTVEVNSRSSVPVRAREQNVKYSHS